MAFCVSSRDSRTLQPRMSQSNTYVAAMPSEGPESRHAESSGRHCEIIYTVKLQMFIPYTRMRHTDVMMTFGG